jgi:hypothetical protein
MENFGELFSPKFITFYAHEYTTNTQAKHERFFQNLLRSERVQGKRFR